MLSGRGLCDELITRPEESYRLCCVVVCDLETSRIGAPYIYDISNLRVKCVLPLERPLAYSRCPQVQCVNVKQLYTSTASLHPLRSLLLLPADARFRSKQKWSCVSERNITVSDFFLSVPLSILPWFRVSLPGSIVRIFFYPRPWMIAGQPMWGFLVHKVALWRGFLGLSPFSPVSIIPPMLYNHTFAYYRRDIRVVLSVDSIGK